MLQIRIHPTGIFRVKGGEENRREAKNYRSVKEGYEMMIDKKKMPFI